MKKKNKELPLSRKGRKLTPQEKKRLSLDKDRVVLGGSSQKSTRRNAPNVKASGHRKVRREDRRLLAQDDGKADAVLEKNLRGRPVWHISSPLDEVVARKIETREILEKTKDKGPRGRKRVAHYRMRMQKFPTPE